jgi:preprotein translocase subunit YajC
MYAQLHQVASLWVAQAPSGDPQGGGGPSELLMIPLILAVVYFSFIRPGNKDRQRHQQLMEGLKRGDEVVTTSGILGTVADIAEGVVTLEVSRNVKLRVLASSIHRRTKDLQGTTPDAKKDDKPKAAKS